MTGLDTHAPDAVADHEAFGDPGDPALVLLMEPGRHVEGFTSTLAAYGFHVLRFDPDRNSAVGVTAVLDRLGIAAAHLVGVATGDAIARSLVAIHPDRVLSQCSMPSVAPCDATAGQRDRAPTLVVHTAGDRLEIEGVGPDLPPMLWRMCADAIADNAAPRELTGALVTVLIPGPAPHGTTDPSTTHRGVAR